MLIGHGETEDGQSDDAEFHVLLSRCLGVMLPVGSVEDVLVVTGSPYHIASP